MSEFKVGDFVKRKPSKSGDFPLGAGRQKVTNVGRRMDGRGQTIRLDGDSNSLAYWWSDYFTLDNKAEVTKLKIGDKVKWANPHLAYNFVGNTDKPTRVTGLDRHLNLVQVFGDTRYFSPGCFKKIEVPFKVGDWVTVDETQGDHLRHSLAGKGAFKITKFSPGAWGWLKVQGHESNWTESRLRHATPLEIHVAKDKILAKEYDEAAKPKFKPGDWVMPKYQATMNGAGPFEVRDTWYEGTVLILENTPDPHGSRWGSAMFRPATRQEKIEFRVPEVHTETITTQEEPEMNDTNLEDSRDDWEDLSLGTQFDKAVRGPIGEGNDMNFFVNGVRVTPEEYAETIRKAKVAEESPLLYDRITGAGPFIRVHTDMDEDNRGQVCVYAGNRKAKKSRKHIQAREWVWPQTLTPQTPEPKEDTVTRAFHDGRVKYLNGLRRADWDLEAKTERRADKAEGKLRIYNGLLAGVLLAVAAIGVGELVFQTMNPEPLKTSSFGPAQGSGSKVVFAGGEAYRVPSVDPGIAYYAEDGLLKMAFEPGDSNTPVAVNGDKELTFDGDTFLFLHQDGTSHVSVDCGGCL